MAIPAVWTRQRQKAAYGPPMGISEHRTGATPSCPLLALVDSLAGQCLGLAVEEGLSSQRGPVS